MNDKSSMPAGGSARPPVFTLRSSLLLGLVAMIITGVELARRQGFDVPLPFMMIYGATALAAALAGFRIAMLASAMTSAYAAWAYSIGFGPDTLTGNGLNLSLTVLVAFTIAGLLGYEHDVRSKLLHILHKREKELLSAQERLTGSVAETSEHLQKTRMELGDVRYLMDQAIQSAPIGVVTIDAGCRLLMVNDMALQQFGMTELPESIREWPELVRALEFYRLNGERVLPPDGPVSRALGHGVKTSDFDCRIVGMDNESRHCSGYVGPVRNTRNEIIGAVVMLVDTTMQREYALALQQLTQMLFKVQEEERGQLSRELHEQIGQSLSAIKFSLFNSADPSASPALEASMAQLDRLTDNVRQMSLELRPTALDDFGLATAVRSFLERQQAGSSTRIKAEVDDNIAEVPEEIATVAYRLVQEAVKNAVRHAQAGQIRVGLATENNSLQIEVADDGRGFDVEVTRLKAAAAGHLGLLFMTERARQSGGELRIESAPHQGTRVLAELPLTRGARNAEDAPGADR